MSRGTLSPHSAPSAPRPTQPTWSKTLKCSEISLHSVGATATVLDNTQYTPPKSAAMNPISTHGQVLIIFAL